MTLRNETTGATVANAVRTARGWRERLGGFLGRTEIGRDEGLWFENCSSIHTLGMRTRIDVVFLDTRGLVQRIAVRVRPHLPFLGSFGACSVVELAPGTAERIDLLVGDRLRLIDAPSGAAAARPLARNDRKHLLEAARG